MEKITCGKMEKDGLLFDGAQYRNCVAPEGSTYMVTTGANLVDEIISLLRRLDQRKLNIVYHFTKKLIG